MERSSGVSEDTECNDYLQVSVEIRALSLPSGLSRLDFAAALADGKNLG